ncbi:MAG TPA: hypothetical protein VMU55_04165 [Solirubrobacteraceae bacterium]|nr:hypothetical protein [Solirubrobacteraceae bacterium]
MPTDTERSMVEMMAAYKIPEDDMCKVLKNQHSGKPISRMTLRKHFAAQLDTGWVTGKMRLLAATFRDAIGEVRKRSDGTTEIVRPGNVTAQIWLQKTLYGFRETMGLEVPAATADEPGSDDVTLDNARRVAFQLALGARVVAAKARRKEKA